MSLNILDYPFDAAALLQKRRALKAEWSARIDLTPKRVAILSGVTVGVFQDLLELWLLVNGIRPTFYQGGYGLFYEQLVYDNSELKAFAPDVIYLHTSMRNIRQWPAADAPQAQAAALLADETAHFSQAAQAALSLGCPVILNNFDLPVYRLMGNRDGTLPAGHVRFVRQLNEALAQLAADTPNLYINDLAYLQALHGMDEFSDQTAWYAYKYPCAMGKLPYLAQSVANIIKSLFGKNKKALALDLDNTLWGGVIGDDGADGIVMGTETPEGMAYTEFQTYLKGLGRLGVLLNVNSKNEASVAVQGFERPDSVLKKDDFVCFKANWEPKSRNLTEMAAEINIFPDAFVFLDDNPAEREIVRQQVPGVAVPELGTPEQYIASVDRSGYFELTSFSADDSHRTEMYRENARRTQLQQSFQNYEDYLHSLEMTGEFGAFDAAHAPRITQLINKSNQFNLTTRRYSAAEIDALVGAPDYITLYGRLRDRFGDNGIVSVIIGHIEGDTLDIALWVMSCRVLKRDMEKAMLDCLVHDALARGLRALRGHYYPTAKNLPVKDFYDTMGFTLQSADEQGNKEYLLPLEAGRSDACRTIDIHRI